MIGLVALGGVAVLYAVTASRLDRWSIGAPLVFMVTGVVLGPAVAGALDAPHDSEPVKLVTEFALALILFADASTIGVRHLRGDAVIPVRLLFVALPLTIGLGALLAHLVIPGVGWALAGLIATILTPTDAALSVPVVTNPSVPARIRRALNVESGLNDGIVTPIVVLMIALVAGEEAPGHTDAPGPLKAIGVALVVAVVLGVVGGALVGYAKQRGLTTPISEQLAVVTLAPLSYLVAVQLGGNGFVAAFVAGLCFGSASRHTLHDATEFTETVAMFLSFLVWAFFGAALVGPLVLRSWHWTSVAYALLSLPVVRMLPVALSMIGTRFALRTTLFLGWFGPRGLASVVFLLLAAEEVRITQLTDPLVEVVVWTIALSVALHGLSAAPLAHAYGRATAQGETTTGEHDAAAEPRVRRRGVTEVTSRRSG